MRQLTRTEKPACLDQLNYKTHNWSDVDGAQKAEIWVCLDEMQVIRCAYCEADISSPARHIEHFVQRSVDAKQCFDWGNLFGSCDRMDTCGRHKDSGGRPYAAADLIKPDIEDPEVYLVFDSRGGVNPRKGLSAADARRASETIRILNLNGILSAIRRTYIAGYSQTAEFLAECAEELPEADWRPMLEQEITATRSSPFATAIKHVLMGSANS